MIHESIPFDPSIPQPLQELVSRELESGEQMEWIGMPRRVFFTPLSTGGFVFGIIWTTIALAFTVGAAWETVDFAESPAQWAFNFMFGAPFVLIGFGILSSPLWAYRNALKSVYVITNRRAITFQGGWSTTIRSYPPDKLADVYRKQKADGSGDVIIARRAWRDSEGGNQYEELGFLRIGDVQMVERQLNALVRRSKEAEQISG